MSQPSDKEQQLLYEQSMVLLITYGTEGLMDAPISTVEQSFLEKFLRDTETREAFSAAYPMYASDESWKWVLKFRGTAQRLLKTKLRFD